MNLSTEQRAVLNRAIRQRLGEPVKAHDVRKLTKCLGCARLGLKPEMVETAQGHWHGACIYQQLGEGVLDLPLAERKKLTIADVGVPMMRRLLDAR